VFARGLQHHFPEIVILKGTKLGTTIGSAAASAIFLASFCNIELMD
jgi:hypothetical protein